ncbi:ornithine cyclodeaminase [Ramlibacter sp. H39-3-26]|uniref:ornithine cyclodeaminase n=1 Tax=Curvibacter soli TaxID=3031331 RepID=UPI0023DCBB77|nr:ornithine cyclodeaminase [Ramlibacter sp. H39-3-26]MDF1484545.1 ornithine cyclodeaminase [Ramlibacter sp. H39-3-26]
MSTPRRNETGFLSPARAAEVVRRVGLANCLRGMADCLEADYRRWQDFDKSARTASHSPDGVIELMPVADQQTYAFKYVNGHPRNTQDGMATVMAFGALASVRTGAPLFLSELTLTTALRTAAMSALAARVLARPGSRTMALIGNGAQSEFQALAFHALLGVDTLRIFDTDPAAMLKLAANLRPWKLRVHVCASAEEAAQSADIVTTATADKARATIVHPGMVEPGMHINAVGGDCPGKTELHPGVLRGSAVFVEYEPQTRVEGDIQQMPADFPVTEFWRVLTSQAPGRASDAQVTVFDSVGFALEDYSALRYMHGMARDLHLLDTIDLVPGLPDPKNLYALLRPAPATTAAHTAVLENA